jgi:hypothetical protein
MSIRRTRVKMLIAGLIFLLLFLFATGSAEIYYENTSPIRFSHEMGRPWNHWDYLSVGSLILSASFGVVSLWFLQKDD